MASSLDQAGPMTKSVEDAAMILKVISGHDVHDSTSSSGKVPDYSQKLDVNVKGMKIGIPAEFFGPGLDPNVRMVIDQAIREIEKLGCQIKQVSLPIVKYALAVYYILMPAEVSSNLARYDGIHYGLSKLKEPNFKGTIIEAYEKSRAEGFGPEAKRRIMLGSYVLSAGYYDAYYKKAQKVRRLVKDEFEKIFKDVDLLATPVVPTVAFKFRDKINDPLSMYLSDVMTVPVNPAGIPAISMPAGFVEESDKKLPVGIQLIGPMWSEQKILNLGYAYQQVTDWHKQKPSIKE